MIRKRSIALLFGRRRFDVLIKKTGHCTTVIQVVEMPFWFSSYLVVPGSRSSSMSKLIPIRTGNIGGLEVGEVKMIGSLTRLQLQTKMMLFLIAFLTLKREKTMTMRIMHSYLWKISIWLPGKARGGSPDVSVTLFGRKSYFYRCCRRSPKTCL